MTQTRDHSALGPDSEGPRSVGKPGGWWEWGWEWWWGELGGVPSINMRKDKYIILNFLFLLVLRHTFVFTFG